MSARRKKHRPLNLKACRPGKSRMDRLFDQIKDMEQERKSQKVIAEVMPPQEDIKETSDTPLADGKLDQDLEDVVRKKLKKFNVIEVEAQMNRKLQDFNFTEEQENEDYYIASDNTLSPLMEYCDVISKFIDMANRADSQHVYCSNKIGECDRKIQDFLHELRMPKRNACEGFKLYQLGHNLEIQRQAYKDAIELLRPLANLMNANREFVQRLQNVLERYRGHQEVCENRIYVPRSDLDLPVGDKFRALSKEDQDRMRENLQNSRRRAG